MARAEACACARAAAGGCARAGARRGAGRVLDPSARRERGRRRRRTGDSDRRHLGRGRTGAGGPGPAARCALLRRAGPGAPATDGRARPVPGRHAARARGAGVGGAGVTTGLPRVLDPAPLAGPWSVADARRRRALTPEPRPAARLVRIEGDDRVVAAGPIARDALEHARARLRRRKTGVPGLACGGRCGRGGRGRTSLVPRAGRVLATVRAKAKARRVRPDMAYRSTDNYGDITDVQNTHDQAGQTHIKSLSYQQLISEGIVQSRPDSLLPVADLRLLALE